MEYLHQVYAIVHDFCNPPMPSKPSFQMQVPTKDEEYGTQVCFMMAIYMSDSGLFTLSVYGYW